MNPKPNDQKKLNVNEMIVQQKGQIIAALPRHMTVDRFARIAMTEIRKNPKLGMCDAVSLLGAIIQCAQLGLEPGSGLGHAFLVPFNNKKEGILEAQMIPGYKGLIDLSRRSGAVETISARIVRAKDVFEYAYGDDERIKHIPFRGTVEEAGSITDVYAIARLRGGGIQREVMSREQVEWVRDRANKNPVWESDFDEMARKTAVRRIVKYLPMSPEIAQALERDDAAYKGESQELWRVLDVDYTPRPQEADPEKNAEAHANAGPAMGTPADAARQAKADATASREYQVAAAELDKAAKDVEKVGGRPEKILGVTVAHVLTLPIDSIFNAADRLKAWPASASKTRP